MTVGKLLCNFIRGDFSSIDVFENDKKVEEFLCNPTSCCLEKYGDRTVSDWFYDFESNEININMDEEE